MSLTDEQSRFVDGLVDSGRYKSASEVVREGLRLLERAERERLLEKWLVEGLSDEEAKLVPGSVLERARDEIRAKIQEGVDAAARGELIDGDEAFRKLADYRRKRRRDMKKQ